MRITITGASGLIGSRLVRALRDRGDEVTVLSRDPARASASLGVEAVRWDAENDVAPTPALTGRDAVVHLAGENVAQRWSDEAKRQIRASRQAGTANLVEGLRRCDRRAAALLAASAVGIYGPRGDERLDESAAPGSGFLADVCTAWERAADAATSLGVRVVMLRTGVVLDAAGGALAKMLPPFRAGVGGPVAGGRQYVPWIHIDDVVGMYLAALDDERWSGAVNVAAPEPVTNREFSGALGRALRRPSVLPVPAPALRVLYGEMAQIVTEGQRAVPRRAVELGYEFRHPDLDDALRSALTIR
jgi:uncharacterized protein (TIGR01777 family)